MNIDLPYHQPLIEDEEIDEVVETLKSGWLTTGPRTLKFEEAFRDYIGCCHAIGLNSCTAGLHLALAAKGFMVNDKMNTTIMRQPSSLGFVYLSGYLNLVMNLY